MDDDLTNPPQRRRVSCDCILIKILFVGHKRRARKKNQTKSLLCVPFCPVVLFFWLFISPLFSMPSVFFLFLVCLLSLCLFSLSSLY